MTETAHADHRYVCHECGAHVYFYPGFELTCSTRGNVYSHGFTIPRKS